MASWTDSAGRERLSFPLLGQSVMDCAIVVLDPAGCVTSWNPGAERIMGYSAEEIVGRHFACFYASKEIAAGHPESDLQSALANEHLAAERRYLRRDGSAYRASVSVSPIHAHGRHLVGFATVTRDITRPESVGADSGWAGAPIGAPVDQTLSLGRTSRAQRRTGNPLGLIADARGPRGRQVLAAAEREREKLAERLHDGPIQDLLSARQDLREAHLAAGSVAVRVAIERAAESVALSIQRLRSTAIELALVAPVTPPLDNAVRALSDDAAARGRFTCRVQIEPSTVAVDDQAVLPIVRELLGNVVKHARASRASVAIQRGAADCLTITVSDDGVGMRPGRLSQALAESHIGLALMAMRVEKRGGALGVTRNDDGGTTARVTLPPVRRLVGDSGNR